MGTDAGFRQGRSARGVRGSFTWGSRSHGMLWSEEMWSLFGLEPRRDDPPTLDLMLGRVTDPEDAARLRAQMTAPAGDPTPTLGVYRISRRDGRTGVIEVRRSAILGADGERCDHGTVQDISRALEPRLAPVTPAVGSTSGQGVNAQLARAIEAERCRIAESMHDDTVASLSSLALRLGRVASHSDDDLTRDRLAGFETEIREIADRVRALMFDLIPPDGEEDLRTSIAAYAGVVFADTSTEVLIRGTITSLEADVRQLAYRAAQEALRNIRRHAGADRVQVEMGATSEAVWLRISDDGVGLDRDLADAGPSHVGLRLIRRRVRLAGGELKLHRGLDGRGLAVDLTFPLTAVSAARALRSL